MTPIISIVVPIYKVEKYLRQCVDSILAQSFSDIEVILVDDGSPDGCPKIVDEYAARDTRVRAVHQANGGYGKAVNRGIELAQGEYVGIIESDDWIEPTMYEKLYAKITELDADIVKCGYWRYNSLLSPEKQNKVHCGKDFDIYDAPQNAFSLEDCPKMLVILHASIWAALYRAEFIKGQKVIESAAASYQDFPFWVETLCRARRIGVVAKPLVHYRIETGQDSSTVRRDARLLVLLDQVQACYDILKKYQKIDKVKHEFFYHAFSAALDFYFRIWWRHKKEFFQKMRKVFADYTMDDAAANPYLDSKELRCYRQIVAGNFWRSMFSTSDLRKFLFSFKTENNGFWIQIAGIRFVKKITTTRLCFTEITLK